MARYFSALRVISPAADQDLIPPGPPVDRDLEVRRAAAWEQFRRAAVTDLVRTVTIPHQIDFIRVASYGHDNSSSGTIRLAKDVELDLRGRHVLLVEDIVDTGTTLAWLTERFKDRQAASVRICALIDKKERRKIEVPLEYIGFARDGFLVGYGLDYAEQYRYLPEIYSLSFP